MTAVRPWTSWSVKGVMKWDDDFKSVYSFISNLIFHGCPALRQIQQFLDVDFASFVSNLKIGKHGKKISEWAKSGKRKKHEKKKKKTRKKKHTQPKQTKTTWDSGAKDICVRGCSMGAKISGSLGNTDKSQICTLFSLFYFCVWIKIIKVCCARFFMSSYNTKIVNSHHAAQHCGLEARPSCGRDWCATLQDVFLGLGPLRRAWDEDTDSIAWKTLWTHTPHSRCGWSNQHYNSRTFPA